MVSKITRAAGVIALVAGLGMTGTAFAAGSASHARGGGGQVTPGSTPAPAPGNAARRTWPDRPPRPSPPRPEGRPRARWSPARSCRARAGYRREHGTRPDASYPGSLRQRPHAAHAWRRRPTRPGHERPSWLRGSRLDGTARPVDRARDHPARLAQPHRGAERQLKHSPISPTAPWGPAIAGPHVLCACL